MYEVEQEYTMSLCTKQTMFVFPTMRSKLQRKYLVKQISPVCTGSSSALTQPQSRPMGQLIPREGTAGV